MICKQSGDLSRDMSILAFAWRYVAKKQISGQIPGLLVSVNLFLIAVLLASPRHGVYCRARRVADGLHCRLGLSMRSVFISGRV